MTKPVVQFGRYLDWSGPWSRGVYPFDFSAVHEYSDEADKRTAVIAATEGGALDASNFYDRCKATHGLIQFCDAGMFGVCDLLGHLGDIDPKMLDSVSNYARQKDYYFTSGPSTNHKWRFWHIPTKAYVLSPLQQSKLWLLNSDGHSWDEPSKEHAKGWIEALSGVWETEEARQEQLRYTARKLLGFVMGTIRPKLFTPTSADDNITLCAQAAYLSFAANLPAVAAKQYDAVPSSYQKGTMPWLLALLRQLTFGPGIAIYTARYNAIRPKLEAY